MPCAASATTLRPAAADRRPSSTTTASGRSASAASWSEAAGADVIRDLLPVARRSRARARRAGRRRTPTRAYRDGVELIHRQLLDVLRRRGVEPLDVVGQMFDPEWHEAVADEPANGRRDGEITAEVRRGYRIGQRLLRPAMVKVAKA